MKRLSSSRSNAEPVIVEIRNEGSGTLRIGSATLEGEGASNFRVSSFPESLAPGGMGELFVRFEPTSPGDLNATLVIKSNDTERPELRFPVIGRAREPCALTAGPPHQTFLLGEIREVQVQTVSSHECKLVRLFVDRRLFDIVNEPELPHTVPAGEVFTLQIQHVGVTTTPGAPVRELRIKESEGSEVVVKLQGEPPVFGCLGATPQSLSFGSAELGARVTRRVTVRNRCDREAAVTAANVGRGFYYFKVEAEDFPRVVPPFESTQIEVVYEPFAPTGDLGTLIINTNDAANPRFEIDLFGLAQVPDMQSFPKGLDFGTVVFKNPQGMVGRSECASRTRFVQIYSTGEADLVIDGLEIESGNDQEFVVSGVTVEGVPIPDFTQPVIVPPTHEMRILLRFFPTRETPSDHQSKLLIHNNVTPGEPAEVTLVGQATGDGATTDIFSQPEGPKLDILWVIDNSCSMFNEQARLIDNLSQFVGYADSQNADYQMAVTDTDSRSRNAGKLERCFPHPSVVTHDLCGHRHPGRRFRMPL